MLKLIRVLDGFTSLLVVFMDFSTKLTLAFIDVRRFVFIDEINKAALSLVYCSVIFEFRVRNVPA